jgi:hypothetical protein
VAAGYPAQSFLTVLDISHVCPVIYRHDLLVAAPCACCLGDRSCWVCLGTGLIELERGKFNPCHRCYGSGVCFLCRPIQLAQVGQPPSLTVERRWWRRKRDSA